MNSLFAFRRPFMAALLLGLLGLTAGCGESSRVVSSGIVGAAPPVLASIAVTPAGISLKVGAVQQYAATGTYSDGTQQDLTAAVTWTSSAPATASINNTTSKGLVTAIAVGTATVTATSGSIASPAVSLTVTSGAAPTLVSIAVTPAAPSIVKGATQQFTATGTYSDNSTQNLTTTATWTSATPATATIGNSAPAIGLAMAVAPGTSAITASLTTGGMTVTSPAVTLTVTPPTLVSIAITPAAPTVIVGSTVMLIATGTYSDGSSAVITTTVTWTSATTTVATISNAVGSNGVATGVALGTSAVTASLTTGATTVTSPAVTLTVTGGFAYALNYDDGPPGTLSQYAIGADGRLAPLATPTVAAGINPFAITADSTHKYLYVANYQYAAPILDGTISQYRIGADGSLTPLTPASVTVLRGPNSVVANPAGPYAYEANYNDNAVSQFNIGAGGGLVPMMMPTVMGGLIGPSSIALNPSGTVAYVTNFTLGNGPGSVMEYVVQANGSLATNPMSASVLTGNNPNYALVDPSGKYLYVVNLANAAASGTVSQYAIQADGTLVSIAADVPTQGGHPYAITVDATSQNAYVPNRTGNSVAHFSIGANGALTLVGTPLVLPGLGPTSVALDSTGKFAYVADRSGTTVSQFAVAADGSLTALPAATAVAGTHPATVFTLR